MRKLIPLLILFFLSSCIQPTELEPKIKENPRTNIPVSPAPCSSQYIEGAGTETNPFQICTPGQFLAVNTSNYYIIMRDLDFSGIAIAPIENFSGSIDGQNFNLSNISISNNSSNQALFVNLNFNLFNE